MPLAYNGTVIEDISVRFEAGRIVDATASKGESVLKDLLKTDDGASRIGEVALVPHSSPISQSGTLFYNTLFDENASCHIALGQCYADTIEGGSEFSPEELKQKGKDGTITPVFRKGEWA